MFLPSVRSHAITAFRGLLEAEEARERALATGTDALLQDLRSRKSKKSNGNSNNKNSGHDLTFVKDVEVSNEILLRIVFCKASGPILDVLTPLGK